MKFLNKQQHQKFIENFDNHIAKYISNIKNEFILFQSNSYCKHILTEDFSSNVFPIFITECIMSDKSFKKIFKTIIKLTFNIFEEKYLVSEEDHQIISPNIHNQILIFRIDDKFNILESKRYQLTSFKVK